MSIRSKLLAAAIAAVLSDPALADGIFNPGASSVTPSTTVISGGTNTRVLFDDSGVVGESAGLTFTKGNGGTTSTLTLGGGGATAVTIATTTYNATPALSFAGAYLNVLGGKDANATGGFGDLGYSLRGLAAGSADAIAFASNVIGSGSLDVLLRRDAANTLALRNGATAQFFNLYGTFTDASNYDRLQITKAAGGNISFNAQAAGTGTAGTFSFNVGIAATTITTSTAATFHTTSIALTNGAGVATGTLTTAPSAGNPTKWIGINDNGTTRYVPAW